MGGPVIVGVTATRSGMTPAQAQAFASLLSTLNVTEIRHGDCVGGDADADAVAASLGIRRVAHPPDNPALRAFCVADLILPERPYKLRNRDIIDACCAAVALPATIREQRFGGTWSTIRYARSVGRPLALILPDGTIHLERNTGVFDDYARVDHL